MAKTAQKGKTSSFDRALLLSLIISFLIGVFVFFVCLSLLSLLTMKYNINFDKMPFMLIGSCLISGLVSGFALSRKLKIKGLLAGLLAALPLMLFETLLVLILSGGGVSSLIYIIIPLVLFSGAIGGILAVNIKPKRRKK